MQKKQSLIVGRQHLSYILRRLSLCFLARLASQEARSIIAAYEAIRYVGNERHGDIGLRVIYGV